MTFEEIMEYCPTNRDIFKELTQAIKRGNVVPFVGAGMSCPIYPAWTSALKELRNKLSTQKYRASITRLLKVGEVTGAAELLEEYRNSSNLARDLLNVFSEEKLIKTDASSLNAMAVSLLPQIFPLSPVITTNYDRVLERVYRDQGKPFDHILTPGNALNHPTLQQNLRNLLKIHGDIGSQDLDYDQIVFTKSSYKRVYADDSDLVRQLSSYYNGKVMLFLGCSLEQDQTVKVLKSVSKDCRLIHFAILPIKARANKDDRIRELGNIRAIFYPDGEYECVRTILEALPKETRTREPKGTPAIEKFLFERLEEVRKNHPSFLLMDADETLFPRAKLNISSVPAKTDAGGETESRLLKDILQESQACEKQNHLMLVGEGGIGKTVSLLSLTGDFPAVYIPLHALDCAIERDYIAHYIEKETLRGSTDLMRKLETELAAAPWNVKPNLLLLLDGYNEILPSNRREISKYIVKWSKKPGIQLMITSRFDDRKSFAELSGNLRVISLQPLSWEIIKNHLEVADLPIPPTNSRIWNVINYPLMLTLYAQIESVRKNTEDTKVPLFWRKSDTAGGIIWNYLQHELWRVRKQAPQYSVFACLFALELVAPYIAYEMAVSGSFRIAEEKFNRLCYEALVRLKKSPPSAISSHLANAGNADYPNQETLKYLMTENLNLFRLGENGEYSLMHQNFRDCFAAIHLWNCAHVAKDALPEAWKQPIDFYVMNYTSDLCSTEEQQADADKLWCLFRKEASSNEITYNMLELQKRLRDYDFSGLDFSGLNLRTFSLHTYRRPGKTELLLPKEATRYKDVLLSEQSFLPEGHTGPVLAVAITPDGQFCVSGSHDGTLRIWSLATGQCMRVLEGHESSVTAVAVTQDGQFCVSGSEDNTLRIWSLTTSQCVRVLEGHRHTVTAVAVTPDGQFCVSGSWDKTLRIWSLATGKCVRVLEEHKGEVTAVTVTPDGQFYVSGSLDNTLNIWDLTTGQCVQVLKGHKDRVNAIAVAPDGQYCVSAANDGTLKRWQIKTGQEVFTLSILPGLTLFGVDMSKAEITPPEFKTTLEQNGAIISSDEAAQ